MDNYEKPWSRLYDREKRRLRKPSADPKLVKEAAYRASYIPCLTLHEEIFLRRALEAVCWDLEPIEVLDEPAAAFAVGKYWGFQGARKAAFLRQDKPRLWKLRLWVLTTFGRHFV
jgi:hypothetical protein